MSRASLVCLCLTIVAAVAGCAEEPGLEEVAATFEGVYALESFTENTGGCDEEGPSRLEGAEEPFLLVHGVKDKERIIVMALTCASPEQCSARAQALDARQPFSTAHDFVFNRSDDQSRLIGETISAGASNEGDGVCRGGGVSNDLMSHPDAQRVLIESARTLSEDYPLDNQGFCTTNGALASIEGKSCGEFRVLVGRRL